jgi:hypothetical protein
MTLTTCAALMMVCLDTLPVAKADTTTKVHVGAFVDTYLAWDAARSRSLDRAYTTQPARSDEFNINLAHVEVSLAAPRIRGRLALQAGTSVQVNYAAEPGALSRHIQEATIGAQLVPTLWLDAGITFAPIGLESWISRDNPTYTRSLIADYTPYYSSGARLTWTPRQQFVAQLHLVNGWQNIAETNRDKAVIARVDWTLHQSLIIGVTAFHGNEVPTGAPAQPRTLTQAFARWLPSNAWSASLVMDRGRQLRATATGADLWSGASLIGTRALGPRTTLTARAEYLCDRAGVLVTSVVPGARFCTRSASLGADVAVDQRVLWRTEVRGFRATEAVWPRDSGPTRGTALVVSSLALTL